MLKICFKAYSQHFTFLDFFQNPTQISLYIRLIQKATSAYQALQLPFQLR